MIQQILNTLQYFCICSPDPSLHTDKKYYIKWNSNIFMNNVKLCKIGHVN